MMQLMEELLECLTLEEMELFWTQAWLIWNQQNSVMHGGKLKDLNSLNKRAEEYVEEFKCAQTQLTVQMRQQPNGDVWQSPPSLEYKLNFDATLFSNLGR